MTAAFVFSFVFPFLLMMALCQKLVMSWEKPHTGWIPTVILASLSALLVILPVAGLPTGRWLVSLYPNPSIPLTALLFSFVLKNAFQLNFLDARAIQTCRFFSLLAGAALYPMALGFGRFDPYCAGWQFSWLFVLLLAITLALLFFEKSIFNVASGNHSGLQFSPVGIRQSLGLPGGSDSGSDIGRHNAGKRFEPIQYGA